MGPNLRQTGQNRVQNKFFFNFLKLVLLVFPEIAYDYGLEHYLTTSRGKSHEKNFWGPKLGPKLRFLPFVKVVLFSLILHKTAARDNVNLYSWNLKNICGRNWDRNDLFYSNVIEHPLKLACFLMYYSRKRNWWQSL